MSTCTMTVDQQHEDYAVGWALQATSCASCAWPAQETVSLLRVAYQDCAVANSAYAAAKML